MTPSKRIPSAIPVGTQFSPALVDLQAFIRAIVAHSGDKSALERAIWQRDVRIVAPKKQPTRRMKSLPLEAAAQYGLLEEGTYVATPLAKKLASLAGEDLYRGFATHILLNRGGLRVVQGVEQMELDRLDITGDTLAAFLSSQGFRVTIHNTAINTLRMWLGKAGLFAEDSKGEAWKYDREVLETLLGLGDEAIGILAGMNAEERAFVVALCRIAPTDWYPAADVRELAEATFQVRLDRGNLKEYLQPLSEAGVLVYASKGTQGGKSALLKVTPLFDKEVLEPFVTKTIHDLDAGVAAYFKKRPEDIYAELDSKDTFKKGQALEAYAILLMRLLGLRFLDWRKRAKETTGRAEVDAVFSGVIGVVPTRWQVQCKNTPSGNVDLEDVAKEVGLIPITQATHVLVVANSHITKDARDYATEVMFRSAITVFLLDQGDFATVKKSPGKLGAILRSKAEAIVRQPPPRTIFSKAR